MMAAAADRIAVLAALPPEVALRVEKAGLLASAAAAAVDCSGPRHRPCESLKRASIYLLARFHR